MTEKGMSFLSFTPQETKAVIFLVVILLAGSGVTLYKKYNPDFAPELLLKESNYSTQKRIQPVISSAISENQTAQTLDGKVNLNTATLKELDRLPGIGQELGKRILDYRQSKGRFSSIDELTEVRGIGQKTFEKLKDLVIVE